MTDNTNLSNKQILAQPFVKGWLIVMAVMVFAMVLLGGATRLTDSGLSITEWKPLLGAIPPLNDQAWADAFDKYRLIPEYQTINKGMSLAEFKFIYWWEWSHRFLGRSIGVMFFLPMAYFWVTKRLENRLKWQLSGLLILGGLQGVLGWYMVMSGLVERTDVSQYRLASHLLLATIIYAAILWVAFGIGAPRARRPVLGVEWVGVFLVMLILLQITAGGFVAGIDAGMGYNTWPLMNGAVVPDGLAVMKPLWRNFFENALMVQFQHRLIAYVIVILAIIHGLRIAAGAGGYGVRSSGVMLMIVAILQVLIGIWTLLMQVPIGLGLLHQGGALILLAVTIYHLHRLLRQRDMMRRT